jgi:signal transduction histidine kinase/CheY-like chemotaxis protein
MACERLASALARGSDDILAQWCATVTADPRQPAQRHALSGQELFDHLPALLEKLIEELCDETPEGVEEDGAKHGNQRRVIGYSVGELLDEMSAFRRIVMQRLDEVALEASVDHREGMMARSRLAAMIDASVKASIEQYLRETEGERDAAQQRLAQRNAELDAANEQKERFLTMLSHELRNPLAPILSAAHVLERIGDLSPGGERQRRIIERQARHLTRLVDDLLDVNRISRGKIDLRPLLIDAREPVRLAVESCRGDLDTGGIHLHCVLPADPLRVVADPTRIAQVVTNLLSNAGKFTDRGGSIGISLSAQGDEAVLSVKDTGIGIAPEMLPRIFDLFSQADTSLVRERSGLGVGLMIARSLVAMHGGTITAHSEGLGLGAEMVVRLPLAPAHHAAAEVAPASQRVTAPAARRRVVLVEDNDDSREALGTALELLGHEVFAAATGADALELARAHRPDVFIVDIGLPDMDGFGVARALRAMPEGAEARLIALSGYGSAADKARAREAGFDHHVTKPAEVVRIHALLGGEAD